MSDTNNKLDQLIESTRQDALTQQARSDAQVNQHVAVPRGKQILAAVLVAMCAVVLVYQYPRFSEPYSWPDAATNPNAAEAPLIELVSLIETYRISQGRYPETLSQIALPEGLATVVASSVPQYRPAETAYTLEVTLPHWRASYDSLTEKVSIEPVGKK
jgi:hypothetical protein